MTEPATLVRLPQERSFPKVSLVSPSRRGFLLLALEVDHRLPIFYWLQSAAKTQIIAELKAYATQLVQTDEVREATVFKTWIRPPGRGAFLKERGSVPVARFDVVLLVECDDIAGAAELMRTDQFRKLFERLSLRSHGQLITTAENIRRIGRVDHKRDGIFLFNYFFADSRNQNLAVWEYTAGWFQEQTGLDNSTLFLPQSADVPYTLINHCRWDSPKDIVPKLLFEPTFRTYVLKHFEANSTAAIPILYTLA